MTNEVGPNSELIHAVLQGHPEVFGELVERYERGVLAVIARKIGDIHAAQDVAQEVFVKAYVNLHTLRHPKVFEAWLYRIARREAATWQRRNGARREVPLDHDIPAAERNGQLKEASQKLLAEVMRLPETERHVILLRYFSQHKVKDIAHILDRSVGTVTKQLSRAHARLRRQYEAIKL